MRIDEKTVLAFDTIRFERDRDSLVTLKGKWLDQLFPVKSFEALVPQRGKIKVTEKILFSPKPKKSDASLQNSGQNSPDANTGGLDAKEKDNKEKNNDERANNNNNSFLLWVLRGIFIILSLGVVTNISLTGTTKLESGPVGSVGPWTPVVFFIGCLLGVLAIIALDIFTKNKQITSLSAIYFGLMLGLLFGDLFSRAIQPIIETDTSKWLLTPLRILITLFFCYICVSTLFQTKDDFRFIIPYVEFSKQIKGSRALLLDTSVIIDGRIADICDTRIIDTRLTSLTKLSIQVQSNIVVSFIAPQALNVQTSPRRESAFFGSYPCAEVDRCYRQRSGNCLYYASQRH